MGISHRGLVHPPAMWEGFTAHAGSNPALPAINLFYTLKSTYF